MQRHLQTGPDFDPKTFTTTNQAELDDVHESLSSERRRHALALLYEREPLAKKELALFVAATEHGKRYYEVTDEEQENVRESLHREHLPDLAKKGYVLWDEAEDTVWLGPESDSALRLIETVELDEPRSFLGWIASIF